MALEHQANRLTRLIEKRAEALDIPGTVVNVEQDTDSGGTITTFVVYGETNKVWVQIYGADVNGIHESYNVQVVPDDGLEVWLRKRKNGDYEITGTRAKENTELYGEFAKHFAAPDKLGQLSYTVWPGRNLQPGRIGLVSTDEPLQIRIEPHWYEWHGEVKLWPGGTLDIEDYLPTTTDQWWWAWVCIDPSDNTPLAVTGEEVAGIALLTDAKLAEIGATLSGLHPVEALRLQEGMTALNRPEYFYDSRIWLGNSQLPTVPIYVSTPYEIIPAGRRLFWPAPLDITTGTLTIDGELIVS